MFAQTPRPHSKRLFGMSWKMWLIALALISVVLLLIWGNYTAALRDSQLQSVLFKDRDFRRLPFELADAHDICHYNARTELGKTLLRSHLDNLSTHYDVESSIYSVVVKADVGMANKYRSVAIHCKIDASQHSLLSYREAYNTHRGILLSSIKFFGKA